jgi:hypothetical protein
MADHISATLDRINACASGPAGPPGELPDKLDGVVAAVDRYAEVLERTPGQ